jgi:hypothetical protein
MVQTYFLTLKVFLLFLLDNWSDVIFYEAFTRMLAPPKMVSHPRAN